MRYFLILGWLLTWAVQPGRAQQLICERGFGSYTSPTVHMVGSVMAISPDSLLLCQATSPIAFVAGASPSRIRTGLVWVGRAQCDTVSVARVQTGSYLQVPADILPRQRSGFLLLGTNITFNGTDSSHVFLNAYTRRGQLRWTHTYRAADFYDLNGGLLEAPDRGIYFASGGGLKSIGARSYLAKTDSMGRLQWRRTYGSSNPQFGFLAPVYTTRGNLLLAGITSTLAPGGRSYFYGRLLEVNQRGDSLDSRVLFQLPGRSTYLTSICRLRDGGFLVGARRDTTIVAYNTNQVIPIFARLDANLNVVWTSINWQLLLNGGQLQTMELADGTLLGVVGGDVNSLTRTEAKCYFLRFAPSGTLLTTDSFQSHYPSGSLREVFTSLAVDSSFVLVGSPGSTYAGYIDHFRIPGLRRVLPAPPTPPAQVFLATQPLAPAWGGPAYPNPASTTLRVPYTLPATPAGAELRAYDAQGRLVWHQALTAGQGEVTLSVQGWAPGLYQLTLTGNRQVLGSQRVAIIPQP